MTEAKQVHVKSPSLKRDGDISTLSCCPFINVICFYDDVTVSQLPCGIGLVSRMKELLSF